MIVRSRWILSCVLFSLFLWPLAAVFAPAQEVEKRVAVSADITGAIGPASALFLQKAIRNAEQRNAEVLILQINTPGGLVSSMREMVKDIIASRVPVIGYVSPSGGHAASAGTYIVYATNVAAMAPGTNLGAATPVQMGERPGFPVQPGDSQKDKKPEEKPAEDVMSRKATNDLVAFIRSLAELRRRNADWAEKAVREGATLHAREAVEQGVVEIVAANVGDLLAALDGRKVVVKDMQGADVQRRLSTKGVIVERFEPDFVTRVLGVISDPNVALILMLIGVYGLIFELASPGNVLPGVIGGIALVLGLYALNQLPLDYAGLALLLLGVAFMVAEAFTPSFGILGFGGIVAFVAGAAMLIDSDVPEFQLSWAVILSMAAFSAAFFIFLIGFLWRAHHLKVQSGEEQMIGSTVIVVDWAGKEGHVWVQGERWNAQGDRAYATGDKLVVKRLEGLTLVVTALPFPEQ